MNVLWRWLKRLAKYSFVAFLLLMLAVSALLWYTTTESFQNMVRMRIIAELERATGGRVEVGSFHVIPLKLQVEVRDLTIHGREAEGQQPYVHVESVAGTVNLSSALGWQLGFHKLVLNRPVIHVVFYPDGSWNLTAPKQNNQHFDVDRLFSVSVSRLEVHDGEVLYQDQRVPLNFTSSDVGANVYYSFLRRQYSGDVRVGRAETLFEGYRLVPWSGKAVFAADSKGLQVKSAKVISGLSNLQFSAVVTNLRAPVANGNYTLNLDLAESAAVLRQLHLHSGKLQIVGTGSWSRERFNSEGKFSVVDLGWQDQFITAKNASGSGNFTVDPGKIVVSQLQGEFLRGSFTGDAEISNWREAPHLANSKPANGSNQQGTIRLKLRDLSLADALGSLGPQFRPVNKLRFGGNVSGSADLRWRQSISTTEAAVSLTVARAGPLQPGEYPLVGDARLSYNFGTQNLAVTDFTATTPATQIHAAGVLARASSLNLSVATSDLREWQPFTNELFPSGAPFALHGRATFNGTASGNLANIALAGNVSVENFDAVVPNSKPPQPVHWDSLTANVQASANALSVRGATLHREDAVIRGDGSMTLAKWRPLPDSPFRMHLDVQDANAEEIALLAGYDHSVSGRLQASFDLSGPPSQLHGQGSFELTQGSVHGYPFDLARGGLAVNGNEVSFRNLTAEMGEARITGDGVYDRQSQRVDLRLKGTNFDLLEFPELQRARVDIAGTADFTAAVTGTLAMPHINADVHVRNLAIGGEAEGDYMLTALSQGTNLHLTGHSQFKNSELQLEGDVRVEQRWPARFEIHFNKTDVDPLIQSYLRGRVTGHSSVSGTLVLQGPLRDPQQLTMSGNLSEMQAEVEKVRLHNDGPIAFGLTDRMLKVQRFHIVGDGTDFTGDGSIQLEGEYPISFGINGQVGVGMLHAYNPDFISSGYLNIQAQVSGTIYSPLFKGKLQIQNAAIADINLPSALSDINGTLSFNQNRVTIESLTATTGGGTVTLGGHADLARSQVNFDLTANAKDVRLRYPPGVSSTATGDLHWVGSSTGSQLSGDITITKLGFTPGFDFGTYLQRTAQVASLPQTDPLLNGIRLDLHVATTPELQMQTSVIRLQGEADLHVRGNAAKPVLLGRADVFEGEAYFNGTKYRLERGGVTFTNPTLTTPNLDLQATTRVRDYEITLSITGNATSPKLNYRSDPPLPTGDIISLLAFGQTTTESAQLQANSNSAFSQQTSSAILGAALNATLNNRAQRLFGNSRIKIDPQGLATETSPTQNGPAVTIEQQVKDNLTLAYTTDVAQTSQQVIRAEYNVTRNISIVAIRDQNGVVSFDVKIRRRHR